MTKKEFNKAFTLEIALNLSTFAKSGSLDKPMICEYYNNATDQMCKDGIMKEYQYNAWSTPKGALNMSYLKGLNK